eukprot:TRINITY_DN9500_c0_g2_i1.p1 TRINITY_DN9500_c0_g2~~TRINITY_DN9500_c0_g2_i1.p1  ORF type:complete len:324 (+),score=52.90 TRINITY_DN9500_c0_g2_i1:934-1905(+)
MNIKSLAAGILNGEWKNIAVLVGAGISCGAGIPDFRSAGGMYDTLKPELLTATEEERKIMRSSPTHVVSWNLFRHNPYPYLELRRPFILGIHEQKWKPTLCHFFFAELGEKGYLRRMYSQNIDGLDYLSGIKNVVSCHGSIGVVSCEYCNKQVDNDWFLQQLKTCTKDIYGIDSTAPKESSPIKCPECGEWGIKPSTVLYGRHLPGDFFAAMELDLPHKVDMLFVVGTSLTVSPANSIANSVSSTCPRIIVNAEPVGQDLGIEYHRDSLTEPVTSEGRDTFLKGAADDSIALLIKELGWKDYFIEKYGPRMAESSRKVLENIS